MRGNAAGLTGNAADGAYAQSSVVKRIADEVNC